ncbi:hypothetical protein [Myroides sp. DF42-4-2]|uniref:hypothetical protein n=1 Tax=Myroides sp. DF42-4-2 TaxID=2746726 RepID=UPI0024BF4499|nr:MULTISPECIES: hypothetical protein [unclassified Myroides]MDM1408522.1 hypothetical protein [Myroides sp. DF42-4-2]WHT39478.1 hypothetical protein QNH98_01885 [Myroides sp. mNGS23_01]
MDYNIEEIEIGNNLKKLSILILPKLAFIPENFDTSNKTEEFIFTETIIELNKYFKAENLNIESLGGNPVLLRSRKNADIYLPPIFIASSILSEDPNTISIILNVISSFIYDNLKGLIGKKTAKVEFYVEKKEKGKISKIEYKGDVEGLKKLDKIIKSL